eukprot:7134032-Heterocapsa_arctica.AAC.1
MTISSAAFQSPRVMSIGPGLSASPICLALIPYLADVRRLAGACRLGFGFPVFFVLFRFECLPVVREVGGVPSGADGRA